MILTGSEFEKIGKKVCTKIDLESGEELSAKLFKELSPVARVYATMAYLGDGSLGTADGKAALALTFIPPASSSNSKYSNLDYKTLGKYFARYNNRLFSNPNFSQSLSSVKLLNSDNVIKEVCGV